MISTFAKACVPLEDGKLLYISRISTCAEQIVAVFQRQPVLQDGEIHVLTRRDSRKEQTTDLADMSVKKRSCLGTGVENSVACSSITGDFNSSDQQFGRYVYFQYSLLL